MNPDVQKGLLKFMQDADSYEECVIALEAAMAYLDMYLRDVTIRSACEGLMMKCDLYQQQVQA